MRQRTALDRAALALGAVSLASAVFVVVRGDFQFVRMRGGGVVVALVLGVLAVAAGWLASRRLTLVAGIGFVAAAGTQVALLTGGDGGFLDGNGSTLSLWLGLGAGLMVLGLTPREALSIHVR
jgi:hypothetical protein